MGQAAGCWVGDSFTDVERGAFGCSRRRVSDWDNNRVHAESERPDGVAL
ncbi:hypothetical protein MPNT_90015 [Candidatus Methylacidithermus pantelleriae]|uniref:Uncharacterized protein n=1 Tax=Candidatus Methylacidithermus pantelleriae TaxID=2744239 RepID=A0A8J2BNK4_9BACT|nr:hypothetical protein MPNT_90015 [Candidatus Methylacidithermus pantelleriae]